MKQRVSEHWLDTKPMVTTLAKWAIQEAGTTNIGSNPKTTDKIKVIFKNIALSLLQAGAPSNNFQNNQKQASINNDKKNLTVERVSTAE